MEKTVLILGYGACGREIAGTLVQRGAKVIVGQRSKPANLPSEIEYIQIDILKSQNFVDAIKSLQSGLTEIVVSLGFAYESKVWARVWPEAMNNIIHVGEVTGVRVVFVDNLYMFGPQSAPISEDLPLYSGTALVKPKVRADITKIWMTACSEHRVKFVALRAPDFYGPACEQSHLGQAVFPNMISGKAAQFLVPLDVPHDYAYTPDIGRAVVELIYAGDDVCIWASLAHSMCAN